MVRQSYSSARRGGALLHKTPIAQLAREPTHCAVLSTKDESHCHNVLRYLPPLLLSTPKPARREHPTGEETIWRPDAVYWLWRVKLLLVSCNLIYVYIYIVAFCVSDRQRTRQYPMRHLVDFGPKEGKLLCVVVHWSLFSLSKLHFVLCLFPLLLPECIRNSLR